MSKLMILDFIDGTVVDGPGFRLSIYCAGCSHRCNGCHNPQSWEIGNGKEMDVEELLQVVKDSPWNVTFSGGDPFFQAEGFAQLARRIKAETSKTVWCYTGYTLEELRDPDLQFRGSSNQRILQKEEILQRISLVK